MANPTIEIMGYRGAKSAYADDKTCEDRFVLTIAHHFNGGQTVFDPILSG